MTIKDWIMKYDGYEELKCTAPCSMYSVLLDNNKIEDPFYGLNELEYTKLSDKDCTFHTKIKISDEDIKKEHIELVFYGLDTICEIFLNGEFLDKTMNMHRTYTYDVKNAVVCGENELRLEFKSPTEYFKKMNDKHFVWTNGDTIPGAAHLRKGLSMSGWDWGPKLPDMGIFRDVELLAYDHDKIDDCFIYQEHKENSVTLKLEVKTTHNCPNCTVVAEIDGQCVELKNGKGEITINDPKLWWPKEYGEQNLYNLIFTLKRDGKAIDSITKRIGLRTLTVSTGPQNGDEFCFVVNDVKIFAMGANYIPQDNLLSRINKEKTQKLLNSCVDANYNCIRIWGGGYYPEDYFYDICDELGLIVWEDFMSACINVWMRAEFEEEFTKEAIDNVKRLRHHPSLGLLCGNNEMEDGLISWDLGNSKKVILDYLKLYEEILPNICEKYAPQTFYWPSSPSSGGGFDEPGRLDKGDTHYWDVWHGGIPFTAYRKHDFRFCSEYGFESFPSMKTIKTFSKEEDWNPFSRVMENHQKCKNGNTKILTYLADTYLYPLNFQDLVYASQLLQAEAIKYGVEHFRRTRGYCMGSIYWQVNDCWPVASWSSIDYYGRYKALHYAAKKFYAPVAVGLFYENAKIDINVSNETMKDFKGRVKAYLVKSDFEVIEKKEFDVSVNSLTSSDIGSFSDANVKDEFDTFFVAELYDDKGDLVVKQVQLFTVPKHYNWKAPDISVECTDIKDGVEILLKSKVFARSVEVEFEKEDIVLSDNYVDITDKNGVRIIAKTDKKASELEKQIQIKSVYDIGR